MHAANHSAQRLGIAGAWTLVFLAVVGLGLSLAVLRRFERTLVRPIDELGSVLAACSGGERRRRFHPLGGAAEFHAVAEVVNRLVEEHFGQRERDWEKLAKLDRLVLLRLLDALPEATFVCDAAGNVAASNRAALELLGETGGARLRGALAEVCTSGQGSGAIVIEPVGGGWLCRVGKPAR